MNKRLLQWAALAVTMGVFVCSCEREKDIIADDLQAGCLSLVMDRVSTRSEAGSPTQVYTYSAGRTQDGMAFTLEEVVTELDYADADVAETRGTPAYTENVTSLYGNSFFGVLYPETGQTQIAGDEAFTIMPGMTGTGNKPVWRRVIGFNPFTQSDPLYFFLRMPENPAGVSNLQYNKNTAGTIEFDFETPSTAAAQQDIVFAARKMGEADYLNEMKTNGGAAVLFRHALTGVKFAIANNNTVAGARHPEGTIETFITEVSITGLKNKGHVVFNPTGTENSSQVDNIGEHSSAGSFTWSDVTGTNTTAVYTQTYTEDNIVDFAKNDAVGAPDSFYAAGQDNNLNDANASLTFWFIPQAITSDLKLTVKFRIWDGSKLGAVQELELDLGTVITAQADKPTYTNKIWSAGQLRTFMLKPNMVDVEITDTVNGFTKNNVVIRNTGNVKAYLRAHIVANWHGTMTMGSPAESVDGIALGYTSATENTFLEGWRIASVSGTTATDNFGGVFTGLPGSDWVKGPDDFYYYTQPVDPGAETGSKLFTEYNLDTTQHPVPTIYYLDSSRQQFTNVRLVMEIPVQAILAKEGKTYQQAWAEADVTLP